MEVERRQKIVHNYLANPSLSFAAIAKATKIPPSTVRDVIQRFKESQTIERAAGSGRKPGRINKELSRKIVRSSKQNPGLSLRDRARRYGTSYQTVRRSLKDAGLKSYRAVKVPNRKDKQNNTAKTRSRKLYDTVLTKFDGCVIMDDETYVKLDQKQIPGHKRYVADKRLNVADKYKYVKVDKYAKKLLVWQAICSCGLTSDPFVTSSTLSKELYISECLEGRLLPFIQQHDVPTIFWPDLATCHYAKACLKWYEENDVTIVTKDLNPPNLPEIRPIEKYWAIVKGLVRKTTAAVSDVASMRKNWIKCANKVDREVVRNMMSSIKGKVRQFVRTGGTEH